MNQTKTQPFSYPVQNHNGADQEVQYQCSPYKLLEYFRLLKWFITSAEYANTFLSHAEEFLNVFERVEMNQYNTDENKSQIMRLIDHILDIDLDYCKYFLTKKNLQKKLIEYYISLGNDEHNILYNNTALQVFFRVLKKFCTYHPPFLQSFITHKNFNWSFEFICLAEDFNLAGAELFEIAKLNLDDQHFRHKIISIIINSDKSKIKTYHYKAAVSYIDQAIQNIDDIVYFGQHGGLEFLCIIEHLRSDFDYDPISLAVAEPTLHLLARTTEWMSPEYTSNNQELANCAMEISQSWDSKMDLFLQLQLFLNSSTLDSVLLPAYKILYNLASSDESLLEILLRHLETEHENYYFARANPRDLSYTSGPKKPCIKAHLSAFSGVENLHLHEEYYFFLRRLCDFALNRYYNDPTKSQIVVNLLLYASIEVIPSLGIHAAYIELLDSQFAQPYVKDHKVFYNYLYRVITSDFSVLESSECYAFIREALAKSIENFTPEQKAAVETSFQFNLHKSCELLQSFEVNNSTLSYFPSYLRLGNLILDGQLSGAVTSNEFKEFLNTLKSKVGSENNVLDDIRNAIYELEVQLSL